MHMGYDCKNTLYDMPNIWSNLRHLKHHQCIAGPYTIADAHAIIQTMKPDLVAVVMNKRWLRATDIVDNVTTMATQLATANSRNHAHKSTETTQPDRQDSLQLSQHAYNTMGSIQMQMPAEYVAFTWAAHTYLAAHTGSSTCGHISMDAHNAGCCHATLCCRRQTACMLPHQAPSVCGQCFLGAGL